MHMPIYPSLGSELPESLIGTEINVNFLTTFTTLELIQSPMNSKDINDSHNLDM